MSGGECVACGLVRRSLILLDLEAQSAEEALAAIAQLFVDRSLCHPSFVEAVLERESRYPSALPMEEPTIAIPHAEAEHTITSGMSVVRLAAPRQFRVMGEPKRRVGVQLIAMFALSDPQAIGDALASLLALFQSHAFRQSLIEAPSEEAAYQLVMERLDG